MAIFDILIGIFTLANTFIALFIVVYAFLFLNKTKSHKDRRPWDYLFLASIIYLIYTLFLMFLKIYNVQVLFADFSLYELSVLFQFIYTGLILLSFISQTDLIFNNEIIIIMKKDTGMPKKAADVTIQPAATPGNAQEVAPAPPVKLEERVAGKSAEAAPSANSPGAPRRAKPVKPRAKKGGKARRKK